MTTFSLLFFVISNILVAVAAGLSHSILNGNHSLVIKTVLGLSASVALLVAAMFAYLTMARISRLHSAKTAIQQFIMYVGFYIIGTFLRRQMENATKRAGDSQTKVLMEMIKMNADTDLGRKYNVASIKTREEFSAKVPLSNFEDYRPYVERMENGEKSVMTNDEVRKFSISSGTTGKTKHIPYTNTMRRRLLTRLFLPAFFDKLRMMPIMEMFAPQKSLQLFFMPIFHKSKCGIPIGPAARDPVTPRSQFIPMTTPYEAMAIMGEPAQLYIHMLFGLMDEQIAYISAFFAGSLLVGLEFLNKNWKQLADDIRYGRLTNTHNIPSEIVENIKRVPQFKPNPKRADQIEAAFAKGTQSVVPRLWPLCRYAIAIATGSHRIYVDRIKQYFGPDIHLISVVYGASEAYFGCPVNEEQRQAFSYSLVVNLSFCEFIPEEDVLTKDPKIFYADQLEVGKSYEVVVTQWSGLWRYRMGDIIKVVGHFNQAPVFEFSTRVGDIINLRFEKTTEAQMAATMHACAAKWAGCKRLADYTVTDSLAFEKGIDKETFELYYVIFVELEGVVRALTDAEVDIFESELYHKNPMYEEARVEDQSIGKAKIFAVPDGTFEALKHKILEKNMSTSNQFKSPKYQKNPKYLRFLYENAYK